MTPDNPYWTNVGLELVEGVSGDGTLGKKYILKLEMEHKDHQCTLVPTKHTSFKADIECAYGWG